MLKGFVLTTLNKLPQIQPDLVRSAENWEDWGMEDLLKALQKWLKINKAEDPPRKHDEKRERNWYTGKREQKVHAPIACSVKKTTGERHVKLSTPLPSVESSL